MTAVKCAMMKLYLSCLHIIKHTEKTLYRWVRNAISIWAYPKMPHSWNFSYPRSLLLPLNSRSCDIFHEVSLKCFVIDFYNKSLYAVLFSIFWQVFIVFSGIRKMPKMSAKSVNSNHKFHSALVLVTNPIKQWAQPLQCANSYLNCICERHRPTYST